MERSTGIADRSAALLSVVVPCFNAEETLPDLIDALEPQLGDGDVEVVFADNGSTDGTHHILADLLARRSCTRIVDASGARGASHARNEGARAARGSLLAFVDADDVIADGWVRAIRAALRTHALVASRFEAHRLNDAEALALRSVPQTEGLMEFRYAPFLPFAGACGLGVRREVFEALDGFDEMLLNGEDIDFCWRAQLAGHPLHFERDAVVHIRLRGSPEQLYRQIQDYGIWTVAIYRKYRPRGMEGGSWSAGIRRWLRLARRLHHLARPGTRRRWKKDAAYALGLLRGSVRFRTLAL